MSTNQQLLERYVVPNYGRSPISFVRGEGSRIWDEEGREYLDFGTGIAVCPLGHCHPVIVDALREQGETLIHCSNLYHIGEQAQLAQHLVENVVQEPGKVFFCNSGAEANEALIKLARLAGGEGRSEVITFDSCFHGRTMAGISATAQPKVQKGFEPLLEGFSHAKFNDLDSLKEKITTQTAAVMLEPIQGEGGIIPASADFLRGVAELCREHDLVFMLDEVQCGVGRAGHVCGWKAILDDPDVVPDAVSWAKGIGGGLPIGAVWIRDRETSLGKPLCDVLGPGTHGSTFGGNPLVSKTSLAVLKEIESQRLWENAEKMGRQLRDEIESWNHPKIEGVRGLGLMLGIVVKDVAHIDVVNHLRDAGLIAVPAGTNVVRLLPALNITVAEVNEALSILKQVFETL
ncbi:MAG: aspartate aminotransferase family protein [Verrucomicrobiota bacterium]